YYAQALPHAKHLQHAIVVDLADASPSGDASASAATGRAPEGRSDPHAPAKVGSVACHDFAKAVDAAQPTWPGVKRIPTDLAAIIYTSGSTGDPKGVMLTHHNMVSAAESISTYLQNKPDDIVLDVLPLSFDYGLYQWLMVNQFGGTLI